MKKELLINDNCEHCGKIINETEYYVITEDSVYLCEKCSIELNRFDKEIK